MIMSTPITVELLNKIVTENQNLYTAYKNVYKENGYVLATSSLNSGNSYVVSDEKGKINMANFIFPDEERNSFIEKKYGISLR